MIKSHRNLLIAAMFIGAFTSITSAQSGKLKQEYDRFKDATGVYIEPMMVLKEGLLGRTYNSVRLIAGFGYQGRVPHNIDSFVIIITSVSPSSWRFEKDRGLIVLADNERLVLGIMDREASSKWDDAFGMNVNNEEMTAKISAEDFKKITYASTVEMQVGYTDFKLKPEHLDALRRLASSAGFDSTTSPAGKLGSSTLPVVRNTSTLEARFQRANELYKQNKFEEAASELREAIRLAPKVGVLHANLGSTLLQQKKFAQAEAELRNAIRLERKTAVFQAMLGEVFDHQQKFAEAEAAYRKAFEMDSNDAHVLNDLGYFLVQHDKELDSSLQMLKRAVSAEPSNGYYLDSLGWAYFKLGRYVEAENYLKEALNAKNSPLDVPYEHLGDLYQRQSKVELAGSAWKESLSVSVDPDRKERLMDKIKSILPVPPR